MHLEFTDEQLELRDGARAALERECPPSRVREIAADGAATAALAESLTWLGWPALTVDVDLGGLGRDFVELAVVLEELGRAAAPGAFVPTMTQFVPVVREVGTIAQAHRFLAMVASGSLTGALALHEGGRWDPETVTSTAERDGDGWLLRGRKQHVLGAPDIDEVAVVACGDDGTLGVFVVPASELTFKRTTSLDPTRSLASVELNGVWVPEPRRLGEPGADARRPLTRALCESTVGLALDALGACGALFDATLDIARAAGPGAGQATEHVLADMAVAVELARATVYRAVCAVAERADDVADCAAVAKAAVGTCQRLVTRHSLDATGLGAPGRGAPGLRHDLALWVGRAKADDLLFGSVAEHHRMLADHMLSGGRSRGTPLVSALLG